MVISAIVRPTSPITTLIKSLLEQIHTDHIRNMKIKAGKLKCLD